MCVQQGFFCSRQNKCFFVHSFSILIFLHIGLQLFQLCKGLLYPCRIIVHVLPRLVCLLFKLLTYPSRLSTSVKESSAFFFDSSTSRSNFYFVIVVVNNIILCFDTSYIMRLRFSCINSFSMAAVISTLSSLLLLVIVLLFLLVNRKINFHSLYSMVCLISSRLVFNHILSIIYNFISPYFVGVQLAPSCNSRLFCSFHCGFL